LQYRTDLEALVSGLWKYRDVCLQASGLLGVSGAIRVIPSADSGGESSASRLLALPGGHGDEIW
jgi:hypothetical protein